MLKKIYRHELINHAQCLKCIYLTNRIRFVLRKHSMMMDKSFLETARKSTTFLALAIMPSDELHYTTCSLNVMIVLRKLSTLQHLQSHLQLAKINVTSSNYALITL
jgi:hypothetical protein